MTMRLFYAKGNKKPNRQIQSPATRYRHRSFLPNEITLLLNIPAYKRRKEKIATTPGAATYTFIQSQNPHICLKHEVMFKTGVYKQKYWKKKFSQTV